MNCLKKEKEIRRQKRSITWLSVCKFSFHFLQSNKNGSFCKIRNYICVQISYICKIRQTPQTLSLITMKLTITFSHLADTFMHLHLCLYSWNNPTDVMCFVSNYTSLCGISCTFLFHYLLFCVVSVPRCWSSGRCLNAKKSEDAGNQTFEANAWVYGLCFHTELTNTSLRHLLLLWNFALNIYFWYFCQMFCLVWTWQVSWAHNMPFTV